MTSPPLAANVSEYDSFWLAFGSEVVVTESGRFRFDGDGEGSGRPVGIPPESLA